MSRFLKYINLVMAVLLAAAGTAAWYYGYRTLPRTSGTVPAPVDGRVSVARDSRGVPHIRAPNLEDALFAQGYVSAQDRLFQLEFVRRQAAGTLAEIFGRVALQSDIESRRLRLRRVAEQHARRLSGEDRRLLSAYARGVNFFLATQRGRYPVEFALLGTDPAPWSLSDSILVALTLYRTLTDSWREELRKQTLAETGEADKIEVLFPVRTGLEPKPGSNAWVLSGSRTGSGKPLLANDPHLGFSLPGVWYQVHIRAPGLHVAGVSLPGVPGVVIGHNDRIAWGMTNVGFDVQDLYEIRLDANRGYYLDGDQPRPARQERETVRVRGGSSAEILLWGTHLGPVVTSEGGRHYALRWTAYDSDSFEFPLLDVNRARNWSDFTAALSRFPGPAQNVVYADVDGNIGYQVAGKLPVRKGYAGDLPVPAGAGGRQWEGYIPFGDLPSVYNPASGAIVTANQNPFPEEFRYPVNGGFASHHRARQILAMLGSGKKWDPQATLAVQKDVYSSFHHLLAGQLARSARDSAPAHPLLAEAVPLLDRWNGQMEIGRPEPLLAELAFQHLRKAVVERASPGKAGAYAEAIAYDVVEKLLRARSPAWFADWDQLLRRVLLDAVEEAVRMQGRNPTRWDYGRYNEVLLKNPVLGDLFFVGKYFRIGPARMSGGPTTVKQTTRRLGPSMRFVADLSAWDQSLMNVTTGQSAQPLSPHYKDQWAAYYVGESFPMQFETVSAPDILELVPAAR